MLEIAKAHNIQPSDLQWYAAFHNMTHHPHIHLLVYSKSGQGYLTNKGIESMRSAFGNDIFRNEQYKLFKQQTEYRNKLKDEFDELLDGVLDDCNYIFEPSPLLFNLILELRKQLDNCKGNADCSQVNKDNYKNYVYTHIIPYFKSYKLCDIHEDDCQRFLNQHVGKSKATQAQRSKR